MFLTNKIESEELYESFISENQLQLKLNQLVQKLLLFFLFLFREDHICHFFQKISEPIFALLDHAQVVLIFIFIF